MVVEFLFLRLETEAKMKISFVKKRSKKTEIDARKRKHQ